MLTYNGDPVPETMPTDRIISSFCNPIDEEKVQDYVHMLQFSDPPPIMGYPTIICDEDYGDHFMSGETITEEHEGERAWYVTDGHHRTMAMIEGGRAWHWVEMDESAFTIESELIAWREAN